MSSCIAGQDQRSTVAIFLTCMSVRVCGPMLFKNLCLSLDSGVPRVFFRTTPLRGRSGDLLEGEIESENVYEREPFVSQQGVERLRCFASHRHQLADHSAVQLTEPGSTRQTNYDTIRYDTRCYFNVRSKADISQLNLLHGTDN